MTDPTKPLAGWRVLVVDDEFDSRAVAMILLEDAGAEVIEAENGQEAWEKIQQKRPNFILSDLSMPEMDGWRLVNDIGRDRGLSEIPVIALTAHAMVGDRERAIAAGFRNHITKPLDPDKFIGQLLAILDELPALQPPQSQVQAPEPAQQNAPLAGSPGAMQQYVPAAESPESKQNHRSAAETPETPQTQGSDALTRTEHDEISGN